MIPKQTSQTVIHPGGRAADVREQHWATDLTAINQFGEHELRGYHQDGRAALVSPGW